VAEGDGLIGSEGVLLAAPADALRWYDMSPPGITQPPGSYAGPAAWRQDTVSGNRRDGPRVLLVKLTQKTSAQGRLYLSGWWASSPTKRTATATPSRCETCTLPSHNRRQEGDGRELSRPGMSPARFIRPSRIEGQRMVGLVWHTGLGTEVEVLASLPRNVEPDHALEAARSGEPVLLGNDRLGWARG
jgi:hypothetical protein